MHALSVKQPHAEEIAAGRKVEEFRTWQAPILVGRDLLIVASRSVDAAADHDGEAARLPRGVAICVVRVVRMIHDGDGQYAWELAAPRRVKPEPIKGSAALFHVAADRIRYETMHPAICALPPTMQQEIDRGEARARARRVRVGRALASFASDESCKPDPYTFQDGDTPIRGITAATPSQARTIARRLADKLGDYVYIMRDGLNVGGEWHEAEREKA